jgi:hypothetical protein
MSDCCGEKNNENDYQELDIDDRTFQYISHMNKSKLIPSKWPEHTSTMLNRKTLFLNENLNNKKEQEDYNNYNHKFQI